MSLSTITSRELFIPTGTKERKRSRRAANAMAIELLNYGIVPDQDLLDRIATQKVADARAYCEKILEMFTIGDLNPPLFPDWENRTFFSFNEVVVQIFGYMFQISGNDLEDPSFMDNLKARVQFDTTKRLKLATEENALDRFQTLVNSRAALDKKSQNDLRQLAKTYYDVAPVIIRSAEARIAVVMGGVEVGESLTDMLIAVNAKPADALRYAAAVKEFEGVKLPSDVKYASLPWKQRVQLMEFLNSFSFDDLSEEMGNNRTAWLRFFRHFHVFQQNGYRAKFAKVVAAAFVSVGSKLDGIPEGYVRRAVHQNAKRIDTTPTGNLAYRTFASRVQKAVDNKDMDAFESEITERPGYLFRNLGSLTNVCTKRTQSRFVELVRSLIDKPSSSILLSIVQIDTNAKYRIIDSKGNTTVNPADYHPVIAEVQGLAERELYRRHGFEGQVEVKAGLENKIVPFLSTNAELDRGTRIPFEDNPYLYFIMHWVQPREHRTDLDHSYVCFDSNWRSETVYFGRQANQYIKQSGDITNAPAPNGGTEYGRIDLDKIPADVNYIVPIINLYSGVPFSENDVAYAGFQFSDSSEFRLQQNHVRYDLSQPAVMNVPFVIDVKKREILIIDFNNRQKRGWTAHADIADLKNIISALQTKKFMTIGRFAKLLSGDSSETSLKITNKGKGDNVSPENLIKLIS